MTLLHYACKAGANGVGNVTSATRTVGLLLDKGADLYLRCRWTDMSAIHYAAYFDVAPVIELLLKASKCLGRNELFYHTLYSLAWMNDLNCCNKGYVFYENSYFMSFSNNL